MHMLDGLLGKISFILGCLYILFIKNHCLNYHKIIFIVLVLIVLILFYKSDQISKTKWCSNEHIIVHSCFINKKIKDFFVKVILLYFIFK